MERCLLHTHAHTRRRRRTGVRWQHSGTNTREGGWRAYEAVHPINQETRILGAAASAAKVRVPVANVWRAWREEIRPALPEQSICIPASSPLRSRVMRQHASCDATCKNCCTLSATTKLALVNAYRQLVTLRLHNSSGFTLSVSSGLAQITTRDGPPAPSATPTVCSTANSRGLLFRGCRWRGQQPRRLTLGFGVKDSETSRADIHFFNALFVR